MTAESTAAISAITAISPGSLIPSSSTPISSFSEISEIVSGTPIWLLWFAGVLNVLYFAESAAATISRVVVFPTLPVIPTNGIERRARRQRPIVCNASFVSFTWISAP